MYLKKKKDFTKDTDVFLNCPYSFSKKDSSCVFNCTNCKDAPCITSCKQNAIFYVSEGVVSIDQSKCNGCGDCLKACPNSAILLRKGKAYKFNLCSSSSFSMFCYKNNKDLLEIVDDVLEEDKNIILNRYLWYRVLDFKENLLREITPKIIETKENKKNTLFFIKT